jgi:hypothetical protein
MGMLSTTYGKLGCGVLAQARWRPENWFSKGGPPRPKQTAAVPTAHEGTAPVNSGQEPVSTSVTPLVVITAVLAAAVLIRSPDLTQGNLARMVVAIVGLLSLLAADRLPPEAGAQ